MKFADYLDLVENTEDEQLLLKNAAEIRDDIAKVTWIPIVGKILTALIVLGECENIAEFRQSEQYDVIKDWNIEVSDIKKGHFSLYPSDAHLQIIKTVIIVVGAVLTLLWLRRKLRRKR